MYYDEIWMTILMPIKKIHITNLLTNYFLDAMEILYCWHVLQR